MKNPWVTYVLLRVGTFAVGLAIMLLIGFNVYIATILAAMIALSISLLLFSKQRNAVSTKIYESRNRIKDADADVEDELSDRDGG